MAGIEALLLLALQAILSGILVGGVYGILSVGLSLAFGVMRIVNFAHGELVMYGMYAGVIASKNFGIDPLLILPLSFLLLALHRRGAISDRVPPLRRPCHAAAAAGGHRLRAGAADDRPDHLRRRCAHRNSVFTGQYVVFGPFFLSQAQIVAFAVAVAATLGVELLLRLTTWGKAVRAVADDLEAAEVVGRQLAIHQYRRVRARRRASPASPAPCSSPTSRPRPRSDFR